jgi:hypothetical protein
MSTCDLDQVITGKINVVALTEQDVRSIAKLHRIPLQAVEPADNNAGWIGKAVIVRKIPTTATRRIVHDGYEYDDD